MIEKNILDRVPKYPGRILLTPVEGMPDTFTMTRADEPTTAGTPIDKATLDGISKNRLTGRYYDLTATKVTLSTSGGAFNPLPTTWTNTTQTGATNGGYIITASGSSGSYQPHRAFDGNTGTYWSSNTSTAPWIQLELPELITISKMKIAMTQPDSWGTTTKIQGLTDSGSWVDLNTFSLPWDGSLVEYTLSNPSTYKSYRLSFSIYTSATITLYEWQISNWNSSTYRYDYTLPTNTAPSTWEKGQRVTVSVPNVAAVGVVSNTLNGIQVNTVLQPNRKYELVYNGSTFDVKG